MHGTGGGENRSSAQLGQCIFENAPTRLLIVCRRVARRHVILSSKESTRNICRVEDDDQNESKTIVDYSYYIRLVSLMWGDTLSLILCRTRDSNSPPQLRALEDTVIKRQHMMPIVLGDTKSLYQNTCNNNPPPTMIPVLPKCAPSRPKSLARFFCYLTVAEAYTSTHHGNYPAPVAWRSIQRLKLSIVWVAWTICVHILQEEETKTGGANELVWLWDKRPHTRRCCLSAKEDGYIVNSFGLVTSQIITPWFEDTLDPYQGHQGYYMPSTPVASFNKSVVSIVYMCYFKVASKLKMFRS